MSRFCCLALVLMFGVVAPLAAQEADEVLDHSNQDKTRENYGGRVIPKANFERAVLDFTNFADTKAPGANFKRISGIGANFSRADLTGANFTGAKLPQAGFSEANLSGAILDNTDLKQVGMDGTKLNGASLKNAKGIVNITRADFTNADLRGCDLSLAKIYTAGSVKFTGAKYDLKTVFPPDIDPKKVGAVYVKAEGAVASNPDEEYGKPLRWFKGVIFYTKGATKEETEKLGDLLEKERNFGEGPERLQLTKSGNVYQLHLSVGITEPSEINDEVVKHYRSFADWLAKKLYSPSTLEVHLADVEFKTLLVIRPSAAAANPGTAGQKSTPMTEPQPMADPLKAVLPTKNFGTALRYGEARLFFTDTVTKDDAKQLGDFLAKEVGFGAKLMVLQLNRAPGKVELRMLVNKATLTNAEALADGQEFANLIARRIYPTSKFELHLCDGNFESLKVLVPK